jgi:hypothetical protein
MPSAEMLPLISMGIEILLFDNRVLKNVFVEFTIKPPYKVINLSKLSKHYYMNLSISFLLLSLDPYQPSIASLSNMGVSG